MNRTRNNWKFRLLFCSALCITAFAYAYRTGGGSLGREGGMRSAARLMEPPGSTETADEPAENSSAAGGGHFDKEEEGADTALTDGSVLQSSRNGFLYSDEEISNEIAKIYGTAEPAADTVSKRQAEKFYSYGKKVSLIADEQSRINRQPAAPPTPVSAAEDSDAAPANPYIDLRNQGSNGNGIEQPIYGQYGSTQVGSVLADQQTGVAKPADDQGETRTERYIRQAAQSEGKL